MSDLQRKILNDAKVKLTEMFDRNFPEQGFFGSRWAAVKVSKVNKKGQSGSILIVTGAMRRSIRSIIRGSAIVFTSDRPYTALHNEGGNFSVTVRQHVRKSAKGNAYTVRSHSRQMNMPQRQFIGDHKRVRDALEAIVNRRLQEFAQTLAQNLKTE